MRRSQSVPLLGTLVVRHTLSSSECCKVWQPLLCEPLTRVQMLHCAVNCTFERAASQNCNTCCSTLQTRYVAVLHHKLSARLTCPVRSTVSAVALRGTASSSPRSRFTPAAAAPWPSCFTCCLLPPAAVVCLLLASSGSCPILTRPAQNKHSITPAPPLKLLGAHALNMKT
jgi:hypothetical protein